MKIITVLQAYNEEAVLSQLFARLKDLQKIIKKYYLDLQLLMLTYRTILARKLAC
jgi:hypothetical protein cdiviTM7_02095